MIYQKKRIEEPKKKRTALEKRINKEIGYAAGMEFFDHRDPLYHITEYFTNTFDAAGMRLGEKMAGNDNAGKKASSGHSFSKNFEQTSFGTEHNFLSQFCDTAFQRGHLASAVYRGTGNMMLFTCLKRTIGQFQPRSARQRMLFEGGSVTKNMAGQPTKAVFNRSTVDSAVAMVADVTRDAQRLTEALTSLAEGKNVLPGDSGINTLRLTFPFLSDERDRELLEKYKSNLAKLAGQPGTEPEQAVLRRAIAKTEALIERKRFMKTQFIMKLRDITGNARDALQQFTDSAYRSALADALLADDSGSQGSEGDADKGSEEDLSGKGKS